MKKYLVTFAQSHSEFRLPELQSIAELYNFPYELADGSDVSRPFMIISLASEEDARLLARRCILIKYASSSRVPQFWDIGNTLLRSVHEFYASGSTYEELHTETRNNRDLWASLIPDTSFKFVIAAFNHRVSQSRQRATVESFSYMDLKGRIDLKTPQVVFTCFEECEHTPAIRKRKVGTNWMNFRSWPQSKWKSEREARGRWSILESLLRTIGKALGMSKGGGS